MSRPDTLALYSNLSAKAMISIGELFNEYRTVVTPKLAVTYFETGDSVCSIFRS